MQHITGISINAGLSLPSLTAPSLAVSTPVSLRPVSRLFITCPVAATVTDWLCRLWQAMTGYLPVVSVASLLAADTPSEQLPVRCAPSYLAQTQASSAKQHLGRVSDCLGQPANTTFRCLRARRNPAVFSIFTTSFTSNSKYLTPWPLGETARIEDYESYDLQ
jgi:hypothetical protein